MASIRRTRHRTFMVMWRELSGKQRSRSFKKRIDAERFKTKIEHDLLVGTYTDPRLGHIPFSEWCRRWNESRLNLKASTRQRDESLLSHHVLPRFGETSLASIRPSDIRAWVADLSTHLSPATTRKCYSLLAAALTQAVDDGLLTRSPCRGIALPRLERSEHVYLTKEQIDLLAGTVPERYRCLILTAAYTGLRWGEVTALRPGDLELLRRRIVVRRNVTRDRGRLLVSTPKTRSSNRSVSIPPSLVSALAEHLARFGSSSDLVFSSPEGDLLRPSNFRRRVLAPAAYAIGLDGLTFHDFRHTHVALLVALGEHPKAIQQRLGHASIRTTLDTYGHLFDGLDDGTADRLEELILGPPVDHSLTLVAPTGLRASGSDG